MKKAIKYIVLILLIVVIAVSSIFIFKNKKDDEKAESEFEELAEIVEQEIITEDNETEYRPLNLQEVYAINNDVVGWLRIDGTNISYPVMQSKDRPSYYLKRNIYKQYSVWGTPYLAEECDIGISTNLIVYGHHIQGRKLFGELEKYKNKTFLENHKFIEFITLDKTYYYEVIDIVVKDISDSSINKYYSSNYISENGKRVITLSTCEYSSKNGRLLVIAEQIGDDGVE